jgi:electron transfer flavoprotein alpha subunit
MNEILVLAEHRHGELREITFEMVSKANQLAKTIGAQVSVIILGKEVNRFAEVLAKKANRVVLIEDERLEFYNSETYERVLYHLISERKPYLILIGHTAMGMDFAPSLATKLNIPISTDCIGIEFDSGNFILTRQIYGGKVNAKVSFNKESPYMITVRAGAFPMQEDLLTVGEIQSVPSPLKDEALARRFIQYVEAAAGEVDITQADILVSVGRGIKDAENIPLVKELADSLGATLACSRPVVDKKWLPKERQVGTSGKTVKPKVYIAIGISGAFQHVAAIKGAGTIIAINKDPKAPIFNVAHYGIVGDLFKVVPVIKDKIKELKQK